MISALTDILTQYRATSQTEREKGTYFEELIRTYFRFEPSYADLYSDVWLYADWAKEIGTPQYKLSAKDTGIDLVAKTHGTDEYHAIQCKCYDADHRISKADIDSFFAASGQKPFTQRIIVTTTNDWTENAENTLNNQTPPVLKIDLLALEASQIDWAKYKPTKPAALKPKKSLRQHQTTARTKVLLGFQEADRGKLIMACGTGKTFTSLKIAEEIAGPGKRVLFLVPSLNLLSQTLTEWTQESDTPLHSFAVCSDAEVGKKRDKDEDIVETFSHELRYPATTDPRRLAEEVKKRHDTQHLSVIFSTYHSLDVISRAQHLHGLPPFDLVICDEAHRTTGATFESESESNFVRIHDNEFIKAKKRLYMTATPRIYADMAKAVAEKDNVALCSMDDETLYGKQFHVITFSEAVELKLLTDYKVLVLAIDAAHVSARIQGLLKDENNQLKVDDAARIIGCWKALSKHGLNTDLSFDPQPMRRAVAFCQVIERQKGSGKHKVSSKQIASMFQAVVDAYQEQEDSDVSLRCEADHVDGGMNAAEKEAKLNWLKSEPPADTCRILSNVRCLSEGVDVPALDAVLFLTPRNSQVDVVQSVGRVMRRTPDGKKKLGYVILPVVIPEGMEAHEALNDNKVYKVVWDVLQALRSHDDRFDAFINKLNLIGSDPRRMEVIAITNKIEKKPEKPDPKSKSKTKGTPTDTSGHTIGNAETAAPKVIQPELQFHVGELERALYAKVVKKCGNRSHWEDWANDIAKIAQTHITRITQIVSDPKNTAEVAAFTAFANELRDDLNDSITNPEVIEMLAQHLITKPVFDALFKDYSFASNNPVSQAMQHVLDVLHEHRLEKEADTLEKFYTSVAMRAEGIDNAEGKQKIVVELYDKFFRNAFPKMTERLGIVYTPVEVVDFIIHSINDLLQSEFGQTLGSKGVHIIDPFTGTGTFITRLLQSGLIKKEEMEHKYKHEIHANEIVLLAYYIAAINIEAVYHSLMKGGPQSPLCGTPPAPTAYLPFEGICLTDTFQLYEKGDMISDLLTNNSDRRKRQKALDIRVIMGNPPYSVGQDSANDDNQNVTYPHLDGRIRETYAAHSAATLQRALYDSYVRAIRWASDRVGKSGIIGFVTNAGFLEANTADGLRKCLAEEFSSIYVFHLRGNARSSGEQRRKEKDNVFGQGSRAPIAITLLVKNPQAKQSRQIYWHDIGDYLSQADKLAIISQFRSTAGITAAKGWQEITPDEHHDWTKQRDDSFSEFIVLGDKKAKGSGAIFENFSQGILTGRDYWCFNFSAQVLADNMRRMIYFYNAEVERYSRLSEAEKKVVEVAEFVDASSQKISWTRGLRNTLSKGRSIQFRQAVVKSLYRPFTALWLYFDKDINEMILQMPKIYPDPSAENRSICITGLGEAKGFSVLMSNVVTEYKTLYNSQTFPLYLYDKPEAPAEDELFSIHPAASAAPQGRPIAAQGNALGSNDKMNPSPEGATQSAGPGSLGRPDGAFPSDGTGPRAMPWAAIDRAVGPESASHLAPGSNPNGYTRRDGISDAGLAHFQKAYPAKGEGSSITKEDLFYYIYGLLHSPDYRTRYADNLSKELPRIPAVKTYAHFRAYSQAGRDLAHWHLNYETVEPYAGIGLDLGNKIHQSTDSLAALLDQHFRVTKMKFGKRPKGEPPSKGGPHSPLCGSPAADSAPHRGLCGPVCPAWA